MCPAVGAAFKVLRAPYLCAALLSGRRNVLSVSPGRRGGANAPQGADRAQQTYGRKFFHGYLLDGSMRMFFPGLTLAVAAKLIYEKWQDRHAGKKRDSPHGG